MGKLGKMMDSRAFHDCLVVHRLCHMFHLPKEVEQLILHELQHSYFFEYYQQLYTKNVVEPIEDNLFSRKYLENYRFSTSEIWLTEQDKFNVEKFDDVNEHWSFWTGELEDPQFQAINCSFCGNYIVCHHSIQEHDFLQTPSSWIRPFCFCSA